MLTTSVILASMTGLALLITFPFRWCFKRFACWIGLHSYPQQWVKAAECDSHGFHTYAKCPWCEKEGLVDSQGNLCA